MAENPERLAVIRTAVEQSCHLLLTPFPEKLDECTGLLAQAVAALSAERDRLRNEPGSPALLAELRQLNNKIGMAGRLLETAAAYYGGWNRLVRSMVAGYTSAGDAGAPIMRGRRLRMEG